MNYLEIKEGAWIGARHFDPPMVPVWIAILEKSPLTIDNRVWITCGSDGHKVGLHPCSRALDVRTKNLVCDDLQHRRIISIRWAARIQKRLGKNYDVVFEEDDENPDLDHIHVEYDPKGE